MSWIGVIVLKISLKVLNTLTFPTVVIDMRGILGHNPEGNLPAGSSPGPGEASSSFLTNLFLKL